MRSRSYVVPGLLVGYTVLLLVALLAPSSDEQSAMVSWLGRVLADLGLPGWLSSYQRLEVAMNAVIIAPVTFLGGIVRPSFGWRDWTACGFLASLTVEAVQLVLLPGRDGSFSDVVANTLGALVGALVLQGGRTIIGATVSVPGYAGSDT
jgi:hypothetical protein